MELGGAGGAAIVLVDVRVAVFFGRIWISIHSQLKSILTILESETFSVSPPHLIRQVLIRSREDCCTGRSPGLGKAVRRWPHPSQSSSGGGWKAARAGGVEECLGEHWAQGRFVSFHIGMAGAILTQLAGRECLHGSMTEQSGPAGDEGC